MSKLALLGGRPVIDKSLKRYNPIGNEEVEAGIKVIKSGILSKYLGTWSKDFYGGKFVQLHEQGWADKFGVKHAISMNSATSCLYAAIGAIGVGPGDEVIVSPFTMSASATAIIAFNAIPVFADIEIETFNIDPISVEKNITKNTRAIMVPNIFGHPAEFNKLKDIANKHNLRIIEDNAQSILSKYHGQFSGTIGDIGVFSLNYHKHINTGEGGICLTNNDELAERLQLIRNHAEAVVEDKGVSNLINMIGFNFRLGEIESAIGIEQLKKVDRLVESRRSLSDRLSSSLKDINYIKIPVVKDNCSHSFYVYPIIYQSNHNLPHRNLIVKALRAEGIPISEGYAKPLYLQPMYQKLIGYGEKGCPFKCPWYNGKVCYKKGICPTAERMYEENLMILQICMFVFSNKEIEAVSQGFHKVFENLDELREMMK